MGKRSVLGLYIEEDSAADALDNLKEAGFHESEYEILTGVPYPEGTFGEAEPQHNLYRWPLIGAICGFSIALLITAGTQTAYPLITGGKPILSIPAMAVIIYEGTMLGAIIFTVIGIVFESRLPRIFMGAYSEKITEGHIGVTVTTDENRTETAEKALMKAGIDGEIIRGWE
jgi:hypothetical protein